MRRTGDVGRERIGRGHVVAVESDDAWGVRVEVELADGRRIHAQPWFPGTGTRGGFFEVDEGDRCVCLPMEGDTGDWIALVGGGNVRDPVPSDWSNDKRALYGTTVEARRAVGKAVDGVVLRPFLDDLSTHLGDVSEALAPVVASSVPVTLADVIAVIALIKTAAIDLTAAAVALKADVDTSKAGAGTLPHCSPVLRGQSEA